MSEVEDLKKVIKNRNKMSLQVEWISDSVIESDGRRPLN